MQQESEASRALQGSQGQQLVLSDAWAEHKRLNAHFVDDTFLFQSSVQGMTEAIALLDHFTKKKSASAQEGFSSRSRRAQAQRSLGALRALYGGEMLASRGLGSSLVAKGLNEAHGAFKAFPAGRDLSMGRCGFAKLFPSEGPVFVWEPFQARANGLAPDLVTGATCSDAATILGRAPDSTNFPAALGGAADQTCQ